MPLTAIVARGAHRGKTIHPHRYEDGCFVVSKTKFELDYLRVKSLTEAEFLVSLGYRLRMSNPDMGVRTPSLIKSESIRSI